MARRMFGRPQLAVVTVTLLGACALMAGCADAASSSNSSGGGSPQGSRQSATGHGASPAPSAVAVPDLNISDGYHATPLTPGVEYQASLLRPLLRIAVPDTGWSGQQYVNKPFWNADLVKNFRDPALPDGVVSILAGVSVTAEDYISAERALPNQAVQPVTAGTLASLPTVEYDSQAVGGDFVSPPEFTVPNGWRFRLIVLTVQSRTLVVGYSSPARSYPAFSEDARRVLATLRFPA